MGHQSLQKKTAVYNGYCQTVDGPGLEWWQNKNSDFYKKN